MSDDDLCIHELDPRTCSLCLHGTARTRESVPPETECGSCHAAIRWVVTAKGKAMPIDADPSEDGAFVINGRSLTGDTLVEFVKPSFRPMTSADRYSSHFATCPDADEHRRR